jgi:hypothetical protein
MRGPWLSLVASKRRRLIMVFGLLLYALVAWPIALTVSRAVGPTDHVHVVGSVLQQACHVNTASDGELGGARCRVWVSYVAPDGRRGVTQFHNVAKTSINDDRNPPTLSVYFDSLHSEHAINPNDVGPVWQWLGMAGFFALLPVGFIVLLLRGQRSIRIASR